MTIGQRLKELREKSNYKKKQVSDLLDMPYTTYNNYETDAREAGSETLKKIANLYGVTIDYILENEIEYTPQKWNDEALTMMEEVHKNPELKMLFKATKNLSPEDIKKTVNIIKAFKGDLD